MPCVPGPSQHAHAHPPTRPQCTRTDLTSAHGAHNRQAKIAEGTAKAMAMRDEKAQKKFAKEEAKAEPEVVAKAAPEPEPEAAAPALKPAEMAARVKELRAVLPKADLKMCKQALDAAGFDFEAVCAAHAVPCRLHAIPHVCVFVCMLYPMSACSCACPCT